jgi:hypothetical protein
MKIQKPDVTKLRRENYIQKLLWGIALDCADR